MIINQGVLWEGLLCAHHLSCEEVVWRLRGRFNKEIKDSPQGSYNLSFQKKTSIHEAKSSESNLNTLAVLRSNKTK